MAYPVAAFVTGWLAERGWDRRYVTSFAGMLAGLAIIFSGGVSWMVIGLQVPPAVAFVDGFARFVARRRAEGRAGGDDSAASVEARRPQLPHVTQASHPLDHLAIQTLTRSRPRRAHARSVAYPPAEPDSARRTPGRRDPSLGQPRGRARSAGPARRAASVRWPLRPSSRVSVGRPDLGARVDRASPEPRRVRVASSRTTSRSFSGNRGDDVGEQAVDKLVVALERGPRSAADAGVRP